MQRTIANLIKQGTIAQVDPSTHRVRVSHGALLTDWLPYFVPFAGQVSIHRPPSVEENCLLLSPSGNTENGIVLCGLHSQQHPSPSQSSDETTIIFPDGASIQYNHISSELHISNIKTAHIQASQSITLDAPHTQITGKLTVANLLTYQSGMSGQGGSQGTQITGNINVSGDVIADGISLTHHIHPETNNSQTGTPQ